MARSTKLLVAICSGLAALAFAGQAFAAYGPRMAVSTESQQTGRNGRVEIVFDQLGRDNATAKASVLVPASYRANVAQAAGRTIGSVEARVAAAGGAARELEGEIVVGNVAEHVAAAAACGTTPAPETVWVLVLPSGGTQVRIPIFVNRLSGESSLRLELCLQSPDTAASPGAATGGRLVFVDMTVAGVFRTPATRSAAVWRGLFTPYQPGTGTSVPAQTVESQAVIPVPRRFAVKKTLAKNRRSVLLRGTLLWGPQAPRGVSVVLLRVQQVRGGFRFQVAGRTRTQRGGKFSFRKALTRTTTFVLYSPFQATRCTGPSIAPAGCVTATVSDTLDVVVVRVPRKRR